MSENVETEFAPDPIDIGLRCLHCGYNLTGTIESRCPECGVGFDRADLERYARGEPVPATPFDREETWRGFWDTWRRVVFRPSRFIDELPPAFDWRQAAEYSKWCYIAAAMLTAAGASIASAGEPNCSACGFIALVPLAATFSFWLFETLMARVLSLACPHARTFHPARFWRGVLHYTSSHTIPLAGWFFACATGLAFAVVIQNPALFLVGFSFAVITLPLIALAWLWGLFTMIRRRSRSKAAALAACAAAPVLACLSLTVFSFLMMLLMYAAWGG